MKLAWFEWTYFLRNTRYLSFQYAIYFGRMAKGMRYWVLVLKNTRKMLFILMLRHNLWMGCKEFHTSFRCIAGSWEDSIIFFHMDTVFWTIFSRFRFKILCEFFLYTEMTAYQQLNIHAGLCIFNRLRFSIFHASQFAAALAFWRRSIGVSRLANRIILRLFHKRFTLILPRYNGYDFYFSILMYDDCLNCLK